MSPNPPGFEVDPWELCWQRADPGRLGLTESTFALSNGHIGLRGTLDEGEPVVLPGTYLNGFYELRDLPYAESGYGYPESGQTIVNVTDGKIVRLLVEDEPMDLRYGHTDEHERTLDFRSGTLRRRSVWTSPTGRTVQITSERLVSFTTRTIAAIRYNVEPIGEDMRLVLQSDLLANEPLPAHGDDPRLAAALDAPLVADNAECKGYRATLAHHTKKSGLRVVAGMDHELNYYPTSVLTSISADGDLARLTVAAFVPAGTRLTITKYIGYGWSGRRSVPALRSQVDAALAMAMEAGWEELLRSQRAFLDSFWLDADIEIDGDPELQQALRFAIFQVLQAGARGQARAIPAKGLTGPGYDGHTFWDTETFVLPMLTYTMPAAAREVLRWRHSTLDRAKDRARELGQAGAMFPWRSINGDECSGYWPAGTAAVHITADIANATARYLAATRDTQFETECGVELLVEGARLWAQMGHQHDGVFRIDGVTGPDEYTAAANNNIFTNLAAQQNLRDAAAACQRRPDIATQLGVDAAELANWLRCADRMHIPYDEARGVHQQSDEFTHLAPWDFEGSVDHYPLLLNYPYYDLYRKQVVKQADLVLAMYLRGDAFTPDQKLRNFDYYEPLTVRDSSLSACCQALIAAEVGYLDLAYDYLIETVFTDLHDLHDNVSSGLHIAALAGAWIDCVAGFGGMRDYGGQLTFAPRLPGKLNRLSFRMVVHDSKILVAISHDSATYRLLSGEPIALAHHGQDFLLGERPITLAIPKIAYRKPPAQPPGREPYRRDAPPSQPAQSSSPSKAG